MKIFGILYKKRLYPYVDNENLCDRMAAGHVKRDKLVGLRYEGASPVGAVLGIIYDSGIAHECILITEENKLANIHWFI